MGATSQTGPKRAPNGSSRIELRTRIALVAIVSGAILTMIAVAGLWRRSVEELDRSRPSVEASHPQPVPPASIPIVEPEAIVVAAEPLPSQLDPPAPPIARSRDRDENEIAEKVPSITDSASRAGSIEIRFERSRRSNVLSTLPLAKMFPRGIGAEPRRTPARTETIATGNDLVRLEPTTFRVYLRDGRYLTASEKPRFEKRSVRFRTWSGKTFAEIPIREVDRERTRKWNRDVTDASIYSLGRRDHSRNRPRPL